MTNKFYDTGPWGFELYNITDYRFQTSQTGGQQYSDTSPLVFLDDAIKELLVLHHLINLVFCQTTVSSITHIISKSKPYKNV